MYFNASQAHLHAFSRASSTRSEAAGISACVWGNVSG